MPCYSNIYHDISIYVNNEILQNLGIVFKQRLLANFDRIVSNGTIDPADIR